MNKFVCPNCGNISYTADTSQIQRCPQCIERHIIVNRNFMDLLKAYNSGNLKLTINRRQRDRRAKSIPVGKDRRASERRGNNATPIGWLTIKHPRQHLDTLLHPSHRPQKPFLVDLLENV